MFPIDVWIFPFFFLSVVEAFAYNGTGDETALKRLGTLAAGVSTCALFRFLLLSTFVFVLPRISRLQTPSISFTVYLS
jgi:hypothetical protein